MDKKKAAVARNTAASTDLRTEIDKMTKLVVFARECLENELVSGGMGYRQETLGKGTSKDLQALATSLEKLVAIKIRYDQHLKNEADNLTPDEERNALVEFFAGMDVKSRRIFMRRLVNRHNELITGTASHPVEISISPNIVDE